MISGVPRKVGSGWRAREKYVRKAKRAPQTMVYSTGSKPLVGHTPQPDDIVFTEANASWVHNPYKDALVIMIEVANNLVHRLLVDRGSAVNILYEGAYQKTSLRWANFTQITSLFYGFIGDSVIPEGTIKLAITLGEPPRMATVVIDFLTVNCPLAFNGVLGRSLLRALKVMMSIHCLTIKFPTVVKTSQVRGRQCNSRKCYNRSLELAENESELL